MYSIERKLIATVIDATDFTNGRNNSQLIIANFWMKPHYDSIAVYNEPPQVHALRSKACGNHVKRIAQGVVRIIQRRHLTRMSAVPLSQCPKRMYLQIHGGFHSRYGKVVEQLCFQHFE